MLTVKNWKIFWFNHIYGICIFFIPILILTGIFSTSFNYLGENTSSFFSIIIKSQPLLVLSSFISVFCVAFLISSALHVFSMSFKYKTKILFGFLFFLTALLRGSSLYPALADKWILVNYFSWLKNFIIHISMLPIDSKLRSFINWMPCILCIICCLLNFYNYMKNLIRQGRQVQIAQNSIYIDELDEASKSFSIQGLSFLIFILFGSSFLFFLNPSFKIHLPQNRTNQVRPNVFIFASDSLRYDRLSQAKFKNIMPYLYSNIPHASFFQPMVVGVPRTFPSWIEIATGNYAIRNGVRTMFPSKSSRQGNKTTIFNSAKNEGYSTVFVSDFAGDIFPRYPFGSEIVDAPTSNLSSLVENGFISFFSPIQAVLLFPKLHRVLPSLLESPEIADSRLVANAFSRNLEQVSHLPKPVFMTTFFSSAHFPYASPGPWYGKFQKEPIIFQKIPDQVLNKNESYLLNKTTDKIKNQTIALYDGGLNSIDYTIEILMDELKEKGWLENSIVLIFGDHGENLYDGNMGMGHGDGVEGEHSNTTPLLIFSHGNVEPFSKVPKNQLTRTIDIAPTLAQKLKLNFPISGCDGSPVDEKILNPFQFPKSEAYVESGIWFTSEKLTPEAQIRMLYPGVVALLNIDPFRNFEFYLRPNYSQAIPSVKERAWVNEKYRLVVRTNKEGALLYLYLRSDTNALHNLLPNKIYTSIANKMLAQLNMYLISRGVEIIPSQNGSFYYAENINQ